MSTIESATLPWLVSLHAYPDAVRGDRRWWTRRGPQISLVLHAVAIVSFIAWSTYIPNDAPPERTITLVVEKPAPEPLKLTQKVEPTPAHLAPQKITPMRAVRTERAPQPRTVASPAAVAQVAAPPTPAPPTSSAPVDTPVAPLAPAVPSAPAAPPAPRVIGQEGIPSDYVNQVFSRINRSAGDSYPRVARLKHLEGRIGYRLVLAPDGSVIRCDIHSSGDDTLDAAATEAIRAAAPFPRLPDLGGSSYVLQGAIVYQAE
jgi:periplasmic protein TonB